ncbi:DUF427 domain-containing protein [Pseudonocardia xishanensis]|uniref:DUF427 domain-containing protein n=1 Tax=Pseudonocardia xishanensis TaxID=630995 RepID=A0ABP8RH93_9PSEU
MGLTRADGPLAPHPPTTVNYVVDGPAHKLFAQPFPRRIRAEVAGRTVLDTVDGMLVHETALLPVLYVPFADLDPEVLEPTDHHTHCPFKGDASYHSLVVGDRRVENAVWSYPEPTERAPWLKGYAALYWSAADAWYDEDERVYAHLTDPFTRVDVRPTSRHVEVWHGDVLVAASDSPTVLSETGLPNRWYLPREAVWLPLAASETRSRCPYKGEARYWTATLPDGTEVADIAWEYPDPLPESTRVAGLLSFWGDAVRVVEG